MKTLPLLILLGYLGTPLPLQAKDLRIVNANILYCNPVGDKEGYEVYIKRLDRLIAKIDKLKPDVLALQEVASCSFKWGAIWVEPAKIIEQRTGYRYYHWISEGVRGVWEEGLAFFWNPRTVTPKNIDCTHLKATAKGWGGGTIRKSLCGMDLDLTDGSVLRLYNTHLNGALSTVQTGEILERIRNEARSRDSVLLVGDFNFLPSSEGAVRIKDFGFTQLANKHVDYVFGLNLTYNAKIRIVDLKKDKTSDHDGLLIELMPPGKTQSKPRRPSKRRKL
ncbi:MAG: endonuclease/exonuclease/phosphatase family protein [Elusimicrobiota bacterium]